MRIASADWRQRAAAGFPVFLRPSGFPVLPVCGVDLRRICAFLSCAALRPQAFAVLVRLRIPDSCRAPLPALGAAGIFPICPVSVSLCRRLPDLRHAGMGAAVVSQQKPHRNAAPGREAGSCRRCPDGIQAAICVVFCGNGRACRPCLWQSRHESVFRAPPAFDL